MLAAGPRDRRIRIQKIAQVRDPDSGELVRDEKDWLLVATVWASKRPLNAREMFGPGQLVAKVDCIFEILYMDGIAPGEDMRILDEKGRAYDITGVEEIGRREGLRIMAFARAEAAA